MNAYTYEDLLYRLPCFKKVKEKVKLPCPQIVRIGRKSAWSNFENFCQLISRNLNYVSAYICSELVTKGSITGNGALLIGGKFTAKQIEEVARKFLKERVVCENCKQVDTRLERDEFSKLDFLACNECKSRKTIPKT